MLGEVRWSLPSVNGNNVPGRMAVIVGGGIGTGGHRQMKRHKEIPAKRNVKRFGVYLSPDSLENRV